MSNLNKTLTSVPPENMDVNSLIDWFGNQCSASAEIFREAEKYYSDLKKYHCNLSELMGMLQELRNQENPEKDEIDEITDTATEIIEAIKSVHEEKMGLSSESMNIEDYEKELLGSEKNRSAKEELQTEIEVFLKNYNAQKAKLNLKTQQDVAELTGINRRYISLIERGKHKPQFKTLKKLADNFGIKVEQLLS